MASQYDLLAGLDITALSSVSQSQLLQMVNQAAPLPNIGGVIYDTITPDVASNPRFARYFWLDSSSTPPTIKIYKTTTSSWQAFAPTGESIINTTLAPHVVALDHMFNDVVADGSLADYILVYDSTGKLITQISKENLLSGLKVNLRQLKSTIAEGEIVAASVNQNNFPKYTSDGIVWGNIDLATQMFDNRLPLDKIQTSPTNGNGPALLLKTLQGTITWNRADDSVYPFLITGSASSGINISRLKKNAESGTNGAVSTNVYPRINAAGNWEFGSDANIVSGGNKSLNFAYSSIGTTGNITQCHLFPSIARGVYVPNVAPSNGSFNWSDTGLFVLVTRSSTGAKMIGKASVSVGAQSACDVYVALVVHSTLTAAPIFIAMGVVSIAGAADLKCIDLTAIATTFSFNPLAGSSFYYRVLVSNSNGAAIVLGKSFDNTITFGASGAVSTISYHEHV